MSDDPSRWIIVENTHEAIIDKESPRVGIRTKNSKGYVTPYCACGTHARGGGCARRAVREEEANRSILDLLSEVLKTDVPREELRAALRFALAAGNETAPPPRPPEDERVRLERDAVDREIAGTVNKASPENLKLFDGRLSALRERRESVALALASGAPSRPARPSIRRSTSRRRSSRRSPCRCRSATS